MGDMYKIVRYTPQGDDFFSGCMHGAKKYHGFEKAKTAMHETVKKKFEGMDKHCADLIDSYCKEYYPDGAPNNFNLLKQFISEYLRDPATFENEFEDKFAGIDFEDERVCFALSYDFDADGVIRHLYIEVSDEAKNKFPEGIISSISIKKLCDPESERYISLTAGKDYGLEIVFSLMSEEDENKFPWEDWD